MDGPDAVRERTRGGGGSGAAESIKRRERGVRLRVLNGG